MKNKNMKKYETGIKKTANLAKFAKFAVCAK
jgi:hypothetical protein